MDKMDNKILYHNRMVSEDREEYFKIHHKTEVMFCDLAIEIADMYYYYHRMSDGEVWFDGDSFGCNISISIPYKQLADTAVIYKNDDVLFIQDIINFTWTNCVKVNYSCGDKIFYFILKGVMG